MPGLSKLRTFFLLLRKTMAPTVICGFPGIGKSFLSKKNGWNDSDSSNFSWTSPGIRNPLFPTNYIEHIRSIDGVVLASSHKVVRDALAESSIPFWICYPFIECKGEYLERYRLRGSPESFLKLLENNWSTWIKEMEQESRCSGRIVLNPGQYISDVLTLNSV